MTTTLITEHTARRLAESWADTSNAGVAALARTGEINAELLASAKRNHDASPHPMIKAFLAYIEHHGTRGPVAGWTDEATIVTDTTARDLAVEWTSITSQDLLAFAVTGEITPGLLATVDRNRDAGPSPDLCAYLKHHGERGPVEGWPERPAQRETWDGLVRAIVEHLPDGHTAGMDDTGGGCRCIVIYGLERPDARVLVTPGADHFGFYRHEESADVESYTVSVYTDATDSGRIVLVPCTDVRDPDTDQDAGALIAAIAAGFFA
jgi:hypothetical protein